jgi:biopolymer transport protein ExbD
VKIGQLSDEMTESANLDITPLIDIVFILLIFFVVTTTFVHELGLPIERPESSTATERTAHVVRVAVGRHGDITVDAQPTSAWRVEAEVRARLREDADAADELVTVIDACRRAGAQDVALGVDRAEGTR